MPQIQFIDLMIRFFFTFLFCLRFSNFTRLNKFQFLFETVRIKTDAPEN